MRCGSGFVIPTNNSSDSAAAPRRYSRCPLWKGWNRPWIIPRRFTPMASIQATRSAVQRAERAKPARPEVDIASDVSFDENAGAALLHATDPADEEPACRELGLEHSSP